MKLKDFKRAFYLLLIMVRIRFKVYKIIGIEIFKTYHPMKIVHVSIRLHLKLMLFTLVYVYLKNLNSGLLAFWTTLAGCFLIVYGKIIHATYLKERKEVEMTYFRHLEEESKNTQLNESTTKH